MYQNHFSKNEFSLHRGYLRKDTLRLWREDPSGQEHRAIFLVLLPSICYANKTPNKNRWSYTLHVAMALRCLYCHCFSPPLTPQPPTSSPITIVTPVTPLYCFGAKRFINKPRIVRYSCAFRGAIGRSFLDSSAVFVDVIIYPFVIRVGRGLVASCLLSHDE